MSRKIEYEVTKPIERVKPLSISGEELKKFEIQLQKYTPYFRLGYWIKLIWRL